MPLNILLSLLERFGYVIMFPIAVLEGPILTVLAGFLTTLGVLNPLWVYLVVVLADVTGDTFYYLLGWWSGSSLPKAVRLLGLTPERIKKAENYFKENHRKAIVLSKIVHGIGTAGLFVSGSIKIPYWRFFFVSLGTAAVQSALFLIIGIFFGQAYMQISRYLDIFGASTIILGLVIGTILVLKVRRK